MSRTSRRRARVVLCSVIIGAVCAEPIDAANTNVTSDATLRAAILNANNGDTITFTADITLAGDLPVVQQNVTILGNHHTLSGNDHYRGFFIGAWTAGTATRVAVAVAIQDLTLTHMKAQGGAGSSGGGGGAGLGGAIFVADLATVTLTNVQFSANAAVGGAGGGSSGLQPGGGGGLGGAAGASTAAGGGGGGGFGSSATGGAGSVGGSTVGVSGSPGIVTGAAPGGGEGNGNSAGGAGGGGGGGGSTGGDGGGGGGVGGDAGYNTVSGLGDSNGGFGGGAGGGGAVTGPGRNRGGFGGGGGAASNEGGSGGYGGGGAGAPTPGSGGFGGGSGGGGNSRTGGGGAGMGGAVFVEAGGSLTFNGPLSVSGNSVTAGSGGGSGASDGAAFGSGLFIADGTAITFSPGAGQTETIADVIADELGSGGDLGATSGGALTKTGSGTLTLTGANTYTGATTVSGGTLLVNGSLAAASTVTVANGATLGGTGIVNGNVVLQSGSTLDYGLTINGTITISAGVTFDAASDAALRYAILHAADGDTIAFSSDITLAADLPAVQRGVTIAGNHHTLSGNDLYRGFLIASWTPGTATLVPVSVTVQDLTITHARAAGGHGGGNSTNAGGGGAGLGGAIFVANLANVTLTNLAVNTNVAIGGAGGLAVTANSHGAGGGGMGGTGGDVASPDEPSGGGGLGVGANGGATGAPGAAGIATGALSGGNSNVAGGSDGGGGGGGSLLGGIITVAAGGGGPGGGAGGVGPPGAGGFGGGGGGGGGRGGFGGGGGGGGGAGGFGGGGGMTSGAGGFGGGNGASIVFSVGNSGGGGLGAGGAIFVQAGGTLTVSGTLSVNGNTVTAGASGGTGTSGSAFGSGVFVQGNGTITFSPGANQTQTVTDVIADQTGSGGTGGNAGAGALTKTGAGTLVLGGTNTYTGATTVSAGTLTVTGSLGASAIAVASGATLGGNGTIGSATVSSGGTLSPGNAVGILNAANLTLNSGSALSIDLNGPTVGTQYDQVNVSGAVSLGGATLSVGLGFAPVAGQVFTIVRVNPGVAVVGTFAGLVEGAALTITGTRFRVSYVGGVTLTVDNSTAPAMASQPSDVTTGPGLLTTFTAAATGSPTPTVQWQTSANAGATWNDISGATSTSYSLIAATTDSGKMFRAVFTNTVGSVTSAGAHLTVVSPTMALDRTALVFGGVNTGAKFSAVTPAQTVRMTQSGAGTVTWTASSNTPWLAVSPASGSGGATLAVSTTWAAGLAATQAGTITITLTGAGNTVGPIAVTLNSIAPAAAAAPFGSFDTPANGATGLAGSVPVTGWTLDDVGVSRVTLCRSAIAGETLGGDGRCNNQVQQYIGDAIFIDGARPDVQGGNLSLPLNTRAGWGYLMLTNFLPNLGNGTFTFTAYAFDFDGHAVSLGSKTITCNNNASVNPFGAIDTPAQGEVISGAYTSFGWVLSPGAAKANGADGGAVQVFVDGTFIGTPGGWGARPDLTALFPAAQYSGIGKALAVIGIDSTSFSNGTHTYVWNATDTASQSGGIGSRFIGISNGSLTLDPDAAHPSNVIEATNTIDFPYAAALRVGSSTASLLAEVDRAPSDGWMVEGRRGFDLDRALQAYPAENGRIDVQAEELDRVELHLSARPGQHYAGYLRTAGGLTALPIGSRLDESTGEFTWMPGVGFYGVYDLVFVRWANGVATARQDVRVTLNTRGSNRAGPQTIIDAPGAGQAFRPDTALYIGGWAADLDSAVDAGVAAVHVWAYPVDANGNRQDPVFLGGAIYGGARPDVAAVYGDRFLNTGYGMIVHGLAPGTYDIAVFSLSTVVGNFTPATVVRVVVR